MDTLNNQQKPKKIKKQKDKRSRQKYSHEVFFVTVIVACLSLLSVVIILTNEYTKILNEQVENKAMFNTSSAVDVFTHRINNLKYNSMGKANDIKTAGDKATFDSLCLQMVANVDALSKVAYCKDDVIYSSEGDIFKSNVDGKIIEASKNNDAQVLGVITDNSGPFERIAISVPITSDVADSLVFLYTIDSLKQLKNEVNKDNLDKSVFFAFCKANGDIIETLHNRDGFLEENVNLCESLRLLTNNKENYDILSKMILSQENGVFFVDISGESFAVAVAKDHDYKEFCFICFYNVQELYSSGYDYIGVILTAIVILLLVILIFAIYFIFSQKSIKTKLSNFGTKNDVLDCFTRIGFEREANKMLERYRGSKFAVISASIRRFDYIAEVIGNDNTTELLKKLRQLIVNDMRLGEIYGYDNGGKFLLFLQYGQYDNLVYRLNKLYRTAYNTLNTPTYNIKLNFGICTGSYGEGSKVSKLVANAELAMQQGGLERAEGNYTIYDESIRDAFLKVSDLEIKMDQGIERGEFKVFYQPKYNMVKECMDGSEALVRWYDKEKGSYRSPEMFLPLFESNGFVARLDHYIFTEVCKLIKNCVEKGVSIIPVSVNVSRLTMLESNFVDFYVKTKEDFDIPDGFITLEFTESVAYENNSTLADMAKRLRSKGFLCSIDDFGTGYSSYNMLKSLDIDELKLDRFFIENCLTNEKARYIIEGAVAIGNNIKVKVTQEGVEDEKTFNYLKKIGCNVIQGYYYSKPLCEEDFLKFIQSHLRWSDTKGNIH